MNKIDPYQTLTVLRTEHRNLLQQKRQDDSSEAYLSAVKTFLQRGMATGCYLEMEDERWDAQSLLDYWANELYHAEQEDLNATLEEFDPDLAPELDDTLCPYMGLDPFDAQNKNLFYGREPLISSLIDRLRNGRFLALSGPSGSGKTSIVMAGLIPQMQEGGLNESASWTYLPRLISGSDPLLNLVNLLQTPDNTPGWADETLKNLYQSDNTLLRLVNRRSGGAPVVLVVDMFEEIFTLCQDQANRSAFMNNLLHFTQDETSAHILILIMRSDLENNLVRQPEFQAAYAQAQMRVTTMNANELRQAIQQPANMVGLKFEEGLVEQLVSDVLGEPVALPLLQFSLLKLWERRNRNRVTWESYRQLGGGRDALATTADTLYDNMNPAEQNTARRILLKMVRPTQGIEVVRIRVLRKQLYESGLATGRIDHVLNHFVRQRLIRINPANTPQNDQFEIAHEALVRNWPRLIGWLEEERVNLRHRLRLAEMTGQWDALKQDDSALLRGLVLEEAQQYNDLNELETTFVAASVAASQRKEQEKEAARQRELEQTRRFARRLALLAVALAFVFVIALGFAVLAWTNAVEAKNNAATAVANEAAASDAQATAETIAVIAKFNADVAVTAQAEAEQNANLAAAAEADAETERDLAAANAIDAENARATAVANEAHAAENASIAETSARLATARELAVAAVTNLINDPQLSLLLALEAFTLPVIANESPPAEATDALYRAIQASQQAFTLAGHTDRVNDTAVSPDGQSIATASSDNSVRLWNTVTGQAISAFEGHTSPVTSLAFSSDGVHLISGSEDSLIILWDVESGNRIRVLQGEDDGAVRAVAFHPDNERVGVGYEAGTARIWNTRTSSALLRQLEHIGPVNDVVFLNEGQQFATAGSDGTVVIQNSDTGIPVFSYEAELNDNDQPVSINAIQFSPDETLMAAAKANGLTRIWEGDNLIATLPGHSGPVFDVAFTPNGQQLATVSADGSAKIWNVAEEQTILTLTGHNGGVTAVAFTLNGDRLITTSEDNSARLWIVEPGLEPLSLTGHRAGLNNIQYNNDGSMVVTAGEDNSARVWETNTGQLQHTFPGHDRPVHTAVFHPTLPIVATASKDTNVRLWDLTTGEVMLPFYFHPNAVNDLAFLGDGSWLATAGEDGLVRIWDTAVHETILELSHDNPIKTVAFNSDSSQLVATSGETAVVWDTQTGDVLHNISGHNGIINHAIFSPDDALLATAGADGVVKLWQLETGEAVRTFSGHGGPISRIAFRSDGAQLATASVDKTAKLWDMETGQALRTILGHTSAVTGVTFSPDQSTLATASLDSTTQLTPLTEINDLLAQAWNRLTRPLTPVECAQFLRGEDCLTTTIGGEPPTLSSEGN